MILASPSLPVALKKSLSHLTSDIKAADVSDVVQMLRSAHIFAIPRRSSTKGFRGAKVKIGAEGRLVVPSRKSKPNVARYPGGDKRRELQQLGHVTPITLISIHLLLAGNFASPLKLESSSTIRGRDIRACRRCPMVDSEMTPSSVEAGDDTPRAEPSVNTHDARTGSPRSFAYHRRTQPRHEYLPVVYAVSLTVPPARERIRHDRVTQPAVNR